MLISHLLLQNFGIFENFSCEFGPGLNLIKGPNEAGKSTLANAITAALFTNPSEKVRKSVAPSHWGSSDGPVLEALLTVDGKPYRLVKDFNRHLVELVSDRDGLKNQTVDFVKGWLADNMGMPSEEVFRATACINQGEISRIENSIDAIKDKLESLVTGGREDRAASLIIGRLETRIKDISGEDGGGEGELARLSKMSEDAIYNIEKLTREMTSLKTKRADLIQVDMAYRNVREDLASKKERLERCKAASSQEGEFHNVSKEIGELEIKLGECHDSLKKIKDLRDRQTGLKNVDPRDMKELEKLEGDIKYLRPKKRELEDDAKDAEKEFKTYRIGGLSIALIIIGAAGAITFALSFFLTALQLLLPFMWYGIGACGVLFTLGLAVTINRNQHRRYLKEHSEKLQSKLQDVDKEYQSQSQLYRTLLSKYSTGSVEDLKRSFWQFDDIEKQIAREKERYEGMLAGRTIQQLESRHQELQDKRALSSKGKKELSQYIVEDADIGRQAQVISQFEERLKDLERELVVLRQQIETAEGGYELLASYLERQEQLKSRMESLLHHMAVLRLTADCINEAGQNVLVSTLEVLNHRTSDILSKLTSSRYSRVRFDKSTFKFEVYSNERGDWVSPEKELSGSTVDQIYLAARLALADLISEDKNSMMILDDPFANYDEKRLENAMKVIKELSGNHQIMLLTSQSHYDRWADTTISL